MTNDVTHRCCSASPGANVGCCGPTLSEAQRADAAWQEEMVEQAQRGSYADHAREFPDAAAFRKKPVVIRVAVPPSLADWLADARQMVSAAVKTLNVPGRPETSNRLETTTRPTLSALQRHLDALPGLVAAHILAEAEALREGQREVADSKGAPSS